MTGSKEMEGIGQPEGEGAGAKSDVPQEPRMVEPQIPGGEIEEKRRSTGGRDLQVSSLVHLLGLPTKDEVKVLEKKIDLLTNKLTALSGKVDRLVSELQMNEVGAALERIDVQVSDLRSVLRKVLPKAMATDGEVSGLGEDSLAHIPKVTK